MDTTEYTASITVSEDLKLKRTKLGTKKNYMSKLGIMVAWLKVNFPETIAIDNSIILPIQNDAVISFFGHLCSPAHILDLGNSTITSTQPPLSISCVQGYRSALVDAYKISNLQVDSGLNGELKAVLDGYEKLINDLKRRGLMKISEGKHYLKADGYMLLAKKLLTHVPIARSESWSSTIFGWSFFVIMWNLMSRSESVDTIMLQHIDWSEDALIIEEQGHKGDQKGQEKFGKHIYANPFNPDICPILAISVLLFSYPYRSRDGKQQLFIGTNSKNRFGDILRRQLSKLTEVELQILGCDATDIGSHSLRKGSSTYALGNVGGPTPVSVFLRMGQTLGKLKDRYIHFGEGADQLCGRTISGLPFNDSTFATLPPHFNSNVLSSMDIDYWNNIIPGFSNYPTGIQRAFPFLLASLLYHESFLRTSLSTNHPIFHCRVFTQNNLLEIARENIILTAGWCNDLKLRATGIPQHLAIALKLKMLDERTKQLEKIVDTLRNEFTDNIPIRIAGAVSDELRSNFAINGILPLTVHDIDVRMDMLRSSIVSELNKHKEASEVSSCHPPNASKWKTWTWNDDLLTHFVPPGWEFPGRICIKYMWDLWNFGCVDIGIRPYKLLKIGIDVMKKHKMRHSRAKIVMNHLISIINEKHLLSGIAQVSELTIQQSDRIYENAIHEMLTILYGERIPKRWAEISVGTIYNKLCIYRKNTR